MKLVKFPIFLAVSLIFLAGCSTEFGGSYGSGRDTDYSRADGGSNRSRGFAHPWEFWGTGRDLSGRRLVHGKLIEADEFYDRGQYGEAEKSYRAALRGTLSPSEKDAGILHLASAQLSSGNTKGALTTVSDYFNAQKIGIDGVNDAFSLFLGYAYARQGDIDQSLAWFSRAQMMGYGVGSRREAATKGAKDVLSHVPANRLDAAAETWTSDVFVAGLISQERSLRSRFGYVPPSPREYWGGMPLGLGAGASPLRDENAFVGGGQSIGILLPLSGTFAGFGKKVKNGIDLAFASQINPGEAPIATVVRDTGVGTVPAIAAAQELASSNDTKMILGPLESELAAQITDIARQSRMPVVTFSKKSSFQTGDGVFRIAPTAKDQTASLVNAAFDLLQMRNFGLIYQQDPNGQEFADAFRAKVNERGGKILFESSYRKDDLNALVSLAQQAEKFKVEGIFFPDNLLAASRLLSSMSADYRKQVRLLGTGSWDDARQLENSRTIFDGVVFVSPFFAGKNDSNVQSFLAAYRAKYGEAPDFLSAQGFDTAALILAALRKAGTDNVSFTEAFTQMPVYEGLTGAIRVAPDGEVTRDFTVVEYKNGNLQQATEQQIPVFTARGDAVASEGLKRE